MITNLIWGLFSLPDPHNKYKKLDLLLLQYIFPLEYMKRHVNSLHKLSKSDQYVVQNLTWSGVYLRSTFLNSLLQKLLILVPLTATRPEVYVATITTFLYYSYNALEETISHMNSLKLNSYTG